MKKIIIAILLSITTLGVSANDIDDVKEYLENLEDSYFRYLSFSERRDAIKTMNDIFDIVEDLHDDDDYQQPILPTIENPELISENALIHLYKDLQSTRNPDVMKQKVRLSLHTTKINAVKLAQLIHAVEHDYEKLLIIKEAYNRMIDKNNIYIVNAYLKTENAKLQLNQWIALQNQVVIIPAPSQPQIAQNDLNILLGNLKYEHFIADQIRLIKAATAHKYLSCDQLHSILTEIKWDSDKVFVIETMYPQLSDPQNAWRLADQLQNSFVKEDLLDWLNSQT